MPKFALPYLHQGVVPALERGDLGGGGLVAVGVLTGGPVRERGDLGGVRIGGLVDGR